MVRLFNQLGTRLILGALLFLVGLACAVILVVRDSVQFLGRNLEGLGVQGLVETNVTDILRATLLTIGYFSVLAIVGVIFAARALTDPIQKLVAGTRLIAAGDLTARIPVNSSDELGVLAGSFNQMADELSRRKDEAEKINASLLKSEERF